MALANAGACRSTPPPPSSCVALEQGSGNIVWVARLPTARMKRSGASSNGKDSKPIRMMGIERLPHPAKKKKNGLSISGSVTYRARSLKA